MTWEPKNKTDDDDDAIISDCDDKSKDDMLMDDEKIKDHRMGKGKKHLGSGEVGGLIIKTIPLFPRSFTPSFHFIKKYQDAGLLSLRLSLRVLRKEVMNKGEWE